MNFDIEKPFKMSWKIFWVIIVLVFGFGGWMTKMQHEANANALGLTEVIEKLDVIQSIDRRLYKIEIKLGIDSEK